MTPSKTTISGGKEMIAPAAACFRYRYRLPCWGLLCAILLWSGSFSYAAGPVIQIDADAQYRFAEHYFATGEYSRAVDEFKRFVYFYRPSQKSVLFRPASGLDCGQQSYIPG